MPYPKGCMAEWWLNNSGQNLLAGVEDDESNPPRLSATFIVDFLRRIPAARESFNRLFGQMTEEEQERLTALAQAAEFMVPDPKAVEDAFQSALNKAGVQTVGPRGGTRAGGNN